MNVQVLSDLHLEFHQDAGERFLMGLDPQGVDVLVVAGDLCSRQQHAQVLRFLSYKYPHVVFIVGNHDYYGCTYLQVHRNLEEVCEGIPNLHWLHNDVVEIEGQRFVGTPLWFRHDPLNVLYSSGLNDFRQILDFKVWVYPENQKALTFLERTVQKGDFVVTHHLPTHRSNEHYRDSQLSRFFVCDVQRLIAEAEPAVWVHGHTHESYDYRMVNTRVVCNPLGYIGLEENPRFDPHLLIEV